LLSSQARFVLTGSFAGEENELADDFGRRIRYGEAFWRAHHEAWRRSMLNQREYCEAQGIPLKAFGNWRAKFKAEPQPPVLKLLYRRGGLSHSLSHMTCDPPAPGPIVPPPREGHRRRFTAPDKRRILDEAGRPGARLSEVARRYGIAPRVLFRWKQDLTLSVEPMFVTVEIVDAYPPSDRGLGDEEHRP
jgi:hypothetical protein